MHHHPRHRRTMPVLWCLTAAALFGASTPAAKALLANLGPWSLAGLLYLGAAFATAPFAFTGGRADLRRDRRNLRLLAGAVLFGGVLGPLLLLTGLRQAPAGSVSLWLNLESTATAILAFLFFREHLTRWMWLAVVLTVAASVLLASPQGFTLAWPGLLVAAACFCWGLDNNCTAVLDGYTPAQITLAKGLVAGSINLFLGHLQGESFPPAALLPSALFVGALGYGASLILYVKGAQALGAVRSQVLFATAPYLGMIGSWLALGEPIRAAQPAAALLMLFALAVMRRDRHAHVHRHLAQIHTHAHRHDDMHHEHAHPDLPADVLHTHPHAHHEQEHSHRHDPDLHHRHGHET